VAHRAHLTELILLAHEMGQPCTSHVRVTQSQQCSPSSQGLPQGVSLSHYARFHPRQLRFRPSLQRLSPSTRNSRSIAGYCHPFSPSPSTCVHSPFTVFLLKNPDEPQKKPELQSYTLDLNECGPMVSTFPLCASSDLDTPPAFRFLTRSSRSRMK
jgi:hypothetical protein